MPDQEYTPQRKNTRRSEDRECAAHEDRLDSMDFKLASNRGWLKGASALVSVVGFVLSTFCVVIINKLSSIQDLLSKNDVTMARYDGLISRNSVRLDIIESKHTWEERQKKEGEL